MKHPTQKPRAPRDPASPCPCGSGLPYGECHAPSDRRRAELRRAGEEVPTRAMLKTPAQIAGIREAGRINAAVLDAVAAAMPDCRTTADIDRVVRDTTAALGGIPTCLGFEGFPATVCTSVNDVVCHGIPSPDVRLTVGDIVNVDCTTTYRGYVGDASRMFVIGEETDPEREALVAFTRRIVEETAAMLRPYTVHLGDIGAHIGRAARAAGYSVVREIGGHGVGLSMHEDPYVCHVGTPGTGMVLMPGMVFTIEPMVNAGSRYFIIDPHDGWTVRTADGRPSAQVEYMVLITEDGHEILSR